MRNFKFFALTLLLTGPAFASYDLERVLQELQSREDSMTTIQFDFKQEINFTQMGNKTVVTGEALFGKNGRVRIAKKTPDQQLTVSDGKKIWVFNPAAGQVWQGAYKKWVTSSILPKGVVPLNNLVKDLKDNFNLKLGPAGKNPADTVSIIGEPKKKELGYSVGILVNTGSWLPVETTYHSESADVVTTLSGHHVNPLTSESTFRFTAPKGIDVIPFN